MYACKLCPYCHFFVPIEATWHEGMLVFSLCELTSLIIVACCAQLLPCNEPTYTMIKPSGW